MNGTCYLGNCQSPGVLTPGSSSSTPFDFTIQLANTDSYRVNGSLAGTRSATGFTIALMRTVT